MLFLTRMWRRRTSIRFSAQALDTRSTAECRGIHWNEISRILFSQSIGYGWAERRYQRDDPARPHILLCPPCRPGTQSVQPMVEIHYAHTTRNRPRGVHQLSQVWSASQIAFAHVSIASERTLVCCYSREDDRPSVTKVDTCARHWVANQAYAVGG